MTKYIIIAFIVYNYDDLAIGISNKQNTSAYIHKKNY